MLADKQLTLIKKACEEGKCTTRTAQAAAANVEDALAQAVKDTVDLLKSSHGPGIYVSLCMYVLMYVCIDVCMYVCMYVWECRRRACASC